MHIASVGVSKSCFLFALAFCGLLLLLIPALQPPARQGDPPLPRPHVRPVQVGNGSADSEHRRGASGPSGTSIKTHISRDGDQSPERRTHSHSVPERGARHEGKAGGFAGSRFQDLLELKDIFIAVKTTRKYHKSRLELLFQTWISQAKEQTYIFTDGEDQDLRMTAGANFINTNCSAAHTRQALCCKMSVEYDKFIESQKKWFCHVDDDNYVILPSLLRLLSSYHHSQDVYLGRPSLDHAIEAAERVKSDGSVSRSSSYLSYSSACCFVDVF
ncbi:hypothetical protein LDENG_00169250 [Lucifuga dentata]|nr:hypothetical protein LDENG_00169250 [Lucifuga dentata]